MRDQRAEGHFSDELVDATVRLVRSWAPQPRPAWVTCVPSRRDPALVASFAARVADGLRLPFRDVVHKVRANRPQSEMANTAQQTRNVAGAFEVTAPVPPGPVLLVDDTVDSRWTLTEVGGVPAHRRRRPGAPARARVGGGRLSASRRPRTQTPAVVRIWNVVYAALGVRLRWRSPMFSHRFAGLVPESRTESHTSGPVNDR